VCCNESSHYNPFKVYVLYSARYISFMSVPSLNSVWTTIYFKVMVERCLPAESWDVMA
jgi:hypothetical protein